MNKSKNVYVALENLRSLYNIGAIYRTCEFFGINKLLLIGYTGIDRRMGESALHQRLSKTSLGTIDKIETLQYETINDIKKAHKKFKLVGIENNIMNTTNLYKWDIPNEDVILVFGNEVDGLSEEAIKICDEIVEIPRFGTHSSLNVTTACGIVLGIIKNNGI